MKFPHIKLAFSVAFVATVTVLFGFNANANMLASISNLFANASVEVTASPSATPSPWKVADKIAEAETMLKGVTLSVGDTDIPYTEQRYATNEGKVSVSTVTIKEPEKQVALGVLNTQTGNVSTILIDKRGGDLIAPAGWQIEVLERPSGIRWNGRNTAFRIDAPANEIVVADVYPNEHDTTVVTKVKGKKVYAKQRTITYDLYAPYSPELHSSELVKSGLDYTTNVVAEAFQSLTKAGVKSVALPTMLVSDAFAGRQDFFVHIPLLEQTDLTEFELDPANTVERAEVIIGANQDQAFNITCNGTGACGWLQFTPGTYANIVKAYPKAGLIKDFKTGAADHVNSMKAAILLYDTNLAGLIKSDGQGVLSDPKLEEYLASSYNGAPKHTYATLKAAILGGIQDWIDALSPKKGGLQDETKGYLVKLRYLQAHAGSLADLAN